VIRPTVAVSVYITFVATALQQNAALRAGLDDARNLEAFVQEVRRYYPFFPAVVARARETFEWRGYRFPRGVRTMLDLYGTNHDPRIWTDPESFWPGRFVRREQVGAYGFIPQGGGEHMQGHRCPGEWITIALMKGAARMLTSRLRYDLPEQDLDTDFARLPALPKSRFVMTSVAMHASGGPLEPVPASPVSTGA
jgi:fatty-acid peroxygenase